MTQWTPERMAQVRSLCDRKIRNGTADWAIMNLDTALDTLESQQAELHASRELLRDLAALAAEYSETHDCGNPYRAKSLAKKARDSLRMKQRRHEHPL